MSPSKPSEVKPLDLEDVIGIRWPSQHRWAPAGPNPQIAFLWDDGGITDLYVVAPGREAASTRVSDGTGGVSAHEWAPDGGSIAYVQHGDLKSAVLLPREGIRERLYLAGAAVAVLRHSPNHRYLACVANDRLALIDRESGAISYLDVPPLATDPQAWAPPAGGWHGSPIEWSPDSQHLLIMFREGLRQIAVVTLQCSIVWRTHARGHLAYLGWMGRHRVTFSDTDDAFMRRTWYIHDLARGVTQEILVEADDQHLSMAVPPIPSPQGERLLFVLGHTGWDHLYVYDPTQSARPALIQITDGACEDLGHRGEQPSWSPDGQRICFASDRLRTGERDLWVINADGRGLQRLTALPGSSVEPQWSHDGRLIAFIRSGPCEAPDLWVAEVPRAQEDGSGESSSVISGSPVAAPRPRQLTSSMPAAWSTTVQAEPEYVTFQSGDGWEIPAYLYRPSTARDSSGKKHPAIIWVHGGPQRLEMRYGWYPTSVAVFDAINQWLVQRGYVLLAINYRGSVGYGRRFERANYLSMLVTDAADLAYGSRYLKQQPYVDAEHVGIWGFSYGGYLTLGTVAKYPDEFKVAINLAGIWDEPQWITWAEERFDMARWHKAKLGGPEHQRTDSWFNGSPRNFVAQIRTPVVSFHGTADGSADFEQLIVFVHDMVEHGKIFEAHFYPGEVHVFKWRKTWRDALPKIARAFDRYLRSSPTV